MTRVIGGTIRFGLRYLNKAGYGYTSCVRAVRDDDTVYLGREAGAAPKKKNSKMPTGYGQTDGCRTEKVGYRVAKHMIINTNLPI